VVFHFGSAAMCGALPEIAGLCKVRPEPKSNAPKRARGPPFVLLHAAIVYFHLFLFLFHLHIPSRRLVVSSSIVCPSLSILSYLYPSHLAKHRPNRTARIRSLTPSLPAAQNGLVPIHPRRARRPPFAPCVGRAMRPVRHRLEPICLWRLLGRQPRREHHMGM
jgi:hypothetical protein